MESFVVGIPKILFELVAGSELEILERVGL